MILEYSAIIYESLDEYIPNMILFVRDYEADEEWNLQIVL